jgi:hypothetical protein
MHDVLCFWIERSLYVLAIFVNLEMRYKQMNVCDPSLGHLDELLLLDDEDDELLLLLDDEDDELLLLLDDEDDDDDELLLLLEDEDELEEDEL